MCSWTLKFTATVVLRLWPVGYWFTENICLCSDQRFWSQPSFLSASQHFTATLLTNCTKWLFSSLIKLLIISLINRLVRTIKCWSVFFPKLEMTSLCVWFCPRPKYILCPITQEERNQSMSVSFVSGVGWDVTHHHKLKLYPQNVKINILKTTTQSKGRCESCVFLHFEGTRLSEFLGAKTCAKVPSWEPKCELKCPLAQNMHYSALLKAKMC